jgi:2-dehydropantoate 2-reductase
MRILVIGAGATGGFFGGRLALAGRDVTFLVRERRAEQLRRIGLILRTSAGEEHIEPKLVSAAELHELPPFDIILLSTKAYSLDQAVADFAPAVGAETMIVPMLNGMRHLDTLVARFGEAPVLGGSCRIVGDLDSEGRVLQMSSLGELAYGERSGQPSDRLARLHATLSGAGFDATLADNILQFMWNKWMILASLNAVNAIGRGSVGEVAAVDALDGAGLRLENRICDEAVAVATAHGYPPPPNAHKMIRERVTERGSTLESSLYRDLQRGGPVEAFQIVGDMAARAREKGLDTPLLEAAFVSLRVYEQRHGY